MQWLRPFIEKTLVVSASVGCLVASAAACADDGGLAIRLALPESEALSPATGGLITDITLEARTGGEVQRLSRSLDDSSAGLELGRLTPGDAVGIAVELRSVGGQLLGYGRSPSPVEIRAGADVEIELNVRRPLAYLPNQQGILIAVDASQNLASAVTAGIDVTGTPAATASSADGGDLFVALASGASSAISLVSTSTHLPSREIASGLRPSPTDLVVSRDGAYAVVAHRSLASGSVGGVTLIDITAGNSTFVELGDVSRLALDSTGELYALTSRSTSCRSPARSAVIYRLSLGDPEIAAQLPFTGSAADIAINPLDDSLLVADPCAGEVVSMLPTSTQPTPLFTLAGASALAPRADSILVAGVDDQLEIMVATVSFVGEPINAVELARPTESTESRDIGADGQSVRVVADADALTILDLAAVPGSESFVVLTEAFYDIEGGFNIPPMQANVWEYQLIDAASESAVHRIRTACELDVDVTFETLVNWRCGRASDQLALTPEFRLESIGLLFGDR